MPVGYPTTKVPTGSLLWMPAPYRHHTRRRVYLQEWLDHTGHSQADVMRAANTNKSTVSRWISDPSRQSLSVLAVFADVCGCDTLDLFFLPGTRPTVAELRQARDTLEKITESEEPPLGS